MRRIGIKVDGISVRDGKIVQKEQKPRDASEAIRQKKSKRQRCVTKAKAGRVQAC